jgi:hypothetical protein
MSKTSLGQSIEQKAKGTICKKTPGIKRINKQGKMGLP